MPTTPQPRLSPHQRTSKSDGSAAQRAKFAGKRLVKFQIIGELGRGGMGVVFEAHDTVLERNVAIKLLPRAVASQPSALERFLGEARAAAKLHHPHVVGIYDAAYGPVQRRGRETHAEREPAAPNTVGQWRLYLASGASNPRTTRKPNM